MLQLRRTLSPWHRIGRSRLAASSRLPLHRGLRTQKLGVRGDNVGKWAATTNNRRHHALRHLSASCGSGLRSDTKVSRMEREQEDEGHDKQVKDNNTVKRPAYIALAGTLLSSHKTPLSTWSPMNDALKMLPSVPVNWQWKQDKIAILIFFTPTFASILTDAKQAETLLRKIVTRLFPRHRLLAGQTPPWQADFTVAVAVVDQLPRPYLTSESQRGDLDASADTSGREGFSYAFVNADELKITGSEHSADVEVPHASIICTQTIGTGEHVKHQAQIPLANTIFQAGRQSILDVYRFKMEIRKTDRGIHRGLTRFEQQSNVPQLTAKLIGQGTWRKPPFISTPLLPLTEPRTVEASMGNIIRQLRRDDGTLVTASAELEEAVNGMISDSLLPEAPVAVWALILKKGDDNVLATEQLRAFWRMNDMKNEALDSLIDISPDVNVFNVRKSRFPDLSSIIGTNGRLHKVVSGGGGWGKKAGLLSISPAVTFGDDAPSGSTPNGSTLQGMEEALGNSVAPGDTIQFYRAALSDLDVLPNRPHYNLFRAKKCRVEVGALPSTVDEMPSVNMVQNDDVQIKAETYPGYFGALSERGIAISSQDNNNRIRAQTMIDVPHARVGFGASFTGFHERESGSGHDQSDSPKEGVAAASMETSSAIAPLEANASKIRKIRMRETPVVRKVPFGAEPDIRITYHIKSSETPESAKSFRRAVSREIIRKHVVRDVEDFRSMKAEPSLPKRERVEATKLLEKPDSDSTFPHDLDTYTRSLDGMYDGELAQEKDRLNRALRKARSDRREAERVLERGELPPLKSSYNVDLSKKPQYSPKQLGDMPIRHFLGVFQVMQEMMPRGLKPSAREIYWEQVGFPSNIVNLIGQYNTLPGNISYDVFQHFDQLQKEPSGQAIAQLRNSAKSNAMRGKEDDFWRKYNALKQIDTARKEFANDTFTAALRDSLPENPGPVHSADAMPIATGISSEAPSMPMEVPIVKYDPKPIEVRIRKFSAHPSTWIARDEAIKREQEKGLLQKKITHIEGQLDPARQAALDGPLRLIPANTPEVRRHFVSRPHLTRIKSGYASRWRRNPMLYAWQLLQKRRERDLRLRLKKMEEQIRAGAENVAKQAKRNLIEPDDETDLDYEMLERRAEAKMRQRRIAMPGGRDVRLQGAAEVNGRLEDGRGSGLNMTSATALRPRTPIWGFGRKADPQEDGPVRGQKLPGWEDDQITHSQESGPVRVQKLLDWEDDQITHPQEVNSVLEKPRLEWHGVEANEWATFFPSKDSVAASTKPADLGQPARETMVTSGAMIPDGSDTTNLAREITPPPSNSPLTMRQRRNLSLRQPKTPIARSMPPLLSPYRRHRLQIQLNRLRLLGSRSQVRFVDTVRSTKMERKRRRPLIRRHKTLQIRYIDRGDKRKKPDDFMREGSVDRERFLVGRAVDRLL